MRLARVLHRGRKVVVLGTPDGLRCVNDLAGRAVTSSPLDLAAEPLTEAELAALILTAPVPEHAVQWLPPLRRTPQNLFCVGLNFHDHLAESSTVRAGQSNDAGVPVWFTKPTTALAAHGAPLQLTPMQTSVDFEGEVAAVIGRFCSRVPVATALDHVYGYTILNDISDRELQRLREQWFLGKGARGHAPLGPWLVTADEVGDPQQLGLRTTVNGEVRQDATTAQMIRGFAELIADLSAVVDLLPGDVVAGGTPAGVGMADGRYLRPGDEVEVTVERLGALHTPVVAGP